MVIRVFCKARDFLSSALTGEHAMRYIIALLLTLTTTLSFAEKPISTDEDRGKSPSEVRESQRGRREAFVKTVKYVGEKVIKNTPVVNVVADVVKDAKEASEKRK
jgi:hypothetical protein